MTVEPWAMVFEGVGRPLVRRSFAMPELAAGEALAEVLCTTLCGSDLHTYAGRRSEPTPLVLGHEIVGRIAALPPKDALDDVSGQPLRVGDRVVWSVAASCDACSACQRGLPQKCERLVKYGHRGLATGHALSGGLASHCHLVRGTAVLRVPDAIPDVVAAMATCATATAVAGLRVAGAECGQRLLVCGAGALGLNVCALGRALGLDPVIVDPDVGRLAFGNRFGAHHACDDTAAALRTLDGSCVDLVVDASGAPAAIERALQALDIGGRLVLLGSVMPAGTVALDPERVVRRLLRIEGVHNYLPEDLAAALEFLESAWSSYPFEELVGARFELAHADQAVAWAVEHRARRVAVVPASTDPASAPGRW